MGAWWSQKVKKQFSNTKRKQRVGLCMEAQPTADKNFLDMYPVEGTAQAVQQEQRWRDLFASE